MVSYKRAVDGYIRDLDQKQELLTNIPVIINNIILMFYWIADTWTIVCENAEITVDESKKVLTRKWQNEEEEVANMRRIVNRGRRPILARRIAPYDNCNYAHHQIDSTIAAKTTWKIRLHMDKETEEAGANFVIGLASDAQSTKPCCNFYICYPINTKYYVFSSDSKFGPQNNIVECHDNQWNHKNAHKFHDCHINWIDQQTFVVILDIQTKPQKSTVTFQTATNDKIYWSRTVFDEVETGYNIQYRLTSTLLTHGDQNCGKLQLEIIDFNQIFE